MPENDDNIQQRFEQYIESPWSHFTGSMGRCRRMALYVCSIRKGFKVLNPYIVCIMNVQQ